MDNERRGRLNKNRGDNFERICEQRPSELGFTLLAKRIDRTHCRGTSKPDLEYIQFPSIKPDCKFTEGRFTRTEKEQLMKEAVDKYGDGAILIIGEKHDRTRLNKNEIYVYFPNHTMMYYDRYLEYLEGLK